MTTTMEMCSSALRGVLVAQAGYKFVVADLAGIENRVLAWLAGEQWKLDAFRKFDTIIGVDEKGKKIHGGPDMYKLAYSSAFHILVEQVNDKQRQIGKVLELMLGYQGGVGAFLTGAASYGFDIEDMARIAWDSIPEKTKAEAADFLEWQLDMGRSQFGLTDGAYIVCESFKRLWRESNPLIVDWWHDLEDKCVAAILNPGQVYTSRGLKIGRSGAWLRIRLPSGRYLGYPAPRLDDENKISYMGNNQYTRQWSRLKTYGGKLAENIVQAVSRDVLGWAMPRIEVAGYDIVLTVHDEVVAEVWDDSTLSGDGLALLMTQGEEWTEGLPLAAEGFEAYRYRK